MEDDIPTRLNKAVPCLFGSVNNVLFQLRHAD